MGARHFACAVTLWAGLAAPVWADARVTVLMDALRMTEVTEILRSEGLAYAASLNADMMDGQGGAFWQNQVDRIYDPQVMQEVMRAAIEDGMETAEIEASAAFFGSDHGSNIIALENQARVAMADPDIEEAARAHYELKSETPDADLALIRRFSDVNDLLDRNVSGAMTTNFQFYRGLSDGKYITMSEAEMLADVWAQEPEIREDSEGWLFGFMLLAYQPLPPGDMEAYIAYSKSEAGQALNAALFAGFDVIYSDISYALGRAVALNAAGSDL
ncbi:MAG: hypothetical protein WBC93_17385 [Sulfitobacter sp.]